MGHESALQFMKRMREEQVEISILIDENPNSTLNAVNTELTMIEEESLMICTKWSAKLPPLQSMAEDLKRMDKNIRILPAINNLTDGEIKQRLHFRREKLTLLRKEMSNAFRTANESLKFASSTPMVRKTVMKFPEQISLIVSDELCSMSLDESLTAAGIVPSNAAIKKKLQKLSTTMPANVTSSAGNIAPALSKTAPAVIPDGPKIGKIDENSTLRKTGVCSSNAAIQKKLKQQFSTTMPANVTSSAGNIAPALSKTAPAVIPDGPKIGKIDENLTLRKEEIRVPLDVDEGLFHIIGDYLAMFEMQFEVKIKVQEMAESFRIWISGHFDPVWRCRIALADYQILCIHDQDEIAEPGDNDEKDAIELDLNERFIPEFMGQIVGLQSSYIVEMEIRGHNLLISGERAAECGLAIGHMQNLFLRSLASRNHSFRSMPPRPMAPLNLNDTLAEFGAVQRRLDLKTEIASMKRVADKSGKEK